MRCDQDDYDQHQDHDEDAQDDDQDHNQDDDDAAQVHLQCRGSYSPFPMAVRWGKSISFCM